jgi:hypothetical protein
MAPPRPIIDWASQRHDDARIIAFTQIVDRVRAETFAIENERARRMQAGRVVWPDKSEYSVIELAAGPNCPQNGGFEYVWRDLFERARNNLHLLGTTPPPRYSPANYVLTWANLIDWNTKLFESATNIRPHFLFPKTTDPYNTDPNLNYRVSTEQSLASSLGNDRWIDGVPKVGYGRPQEVVNLALYQCHVVRPVNYQAMVDQTIAYNRDQISRYSASNPAGAAQLARENEHLASGICRSGGLDDSAPNMRTTFGEWPKRGPTHIGYGMGIVTVLEPNNAQPGQLGRFEMKSLATTPQSQEGMIRQWFIDLHNPTFSIQGRSEQYIWDVGLWIEHLALTARAYSRQNLDTLLTDALAFYAWNHIPFNEQRGLIRMDPGLIQTMQRASAMARFRAKSGGFTQAGAQLISVAGGPIAGAIASVMGEIGYMFLAGAIQGQFSAPDSPKYFFLRVPSLACRYGNTAEELNRTLADLESARASGVVRSPTQQQQQPTVSAPAQLTKLMPVAAGAVIGLLLAKVLS